MFRFRLQNQFHSGGTYTNDIGKPYSDTAFSNNIIRGFEGISAGLRENSAI